MTSYWDSLKKVSGISPVEINNYRVSFCSAEHGYIGTRNSDGTVSVRRWYCDFGVIYIQSLTRFTCHRYQIAVGKALVIKESRSKVMVTVTHSNKTGLYQIQLRDKYKPSILLGSHWADRDGLSLMQAKTRNNLLLC